MTEMDDTTKTDKTPDLEMTIDREKQYCTKPFDPENSRYLDTDAPCMDGEK